MIQYQQIFSDNNASNLAIHDAISSIRIQVPRNFDRSARCLPVFMSSSNPATKREARRSKLRAPETFQTEQNPSLKSERGGSDESISRPFDCSSR